MDKVKWNKTHCGVFKAEWHGAIALQPELEPILNELEKSGLLEYDTNHYVVDSKIHMLMPNQYPCIPNWHYDMIPRDENLKQGFNQCVSDKMFLWVSNEPLTQFKETGTIKPKTWTPFTQKDLHRGTVAKEHIWRCFIRVCPKTILEPADSKYWLRRHCQVYLDSNNFKW